MKSLFKRLFGLTPIEPAHEEQAVQPQREEDEAPAMQPKPVPAEPDTADTPEPFTARTLRYDVHNHILPGVDDGAADLDRACDCIELLIENGYEGAILTPHIYAHHFDNDENDLRERFDRFINDLAGRFDPFKFDLAAEYMMDGPFLDKLYDSPEQLLTFGPRDARSNRGDMLLIEFVPAILPANMDDLLQRCAELSLRPVLAHVERYDFAVGQAGHERVRQWRALGALVQVNIGALVSQYGRTVEQAARDLWLNDLIDLFGTDMHRTDRAASALPEAFALLTDEPSHFGPKAQHSLFAQKNSSQPTGHRMRSSAQPEAEPELDEDFDWPAGPT